MDIYILHLHVYTYICMDTYMYTDCIFIHIIYTCMHIHIYTAYTYIYIYILTYVRTEHTFYTTNTQLL